MTALSEWWLGISPRERLLLALGGAIVAAALIYVLVLEPVGERRVLLARRLAAERAQAAELDRWAAEAASLRAGTGAAAPAPETSLLAALNEAIAAQGLKGALKRLVPANDRQAELAFEGVAFDKLIELVIALHSRYGIDVLRINVERTGPGLASATLSLGRG